MGIRELFEEQFKPHRDCNNCDYHSFGSCGFNGKCVKHIEWVLRDGLKMTVNNTNAECIICSRNIECPGRLDVVPCMAFKEKDGVTCGT